VEDTAKQRELASRVVSEGLSVRQTENLATIARPPRRPRARREKTPQVRSLEDRLKRHLGTRVSIYESKKRGRIVVDFYGADDFDRLMRIMGLPREE